MLQVAVCDEDVQVLGLLEKHAHQLMGERVHVSLHTNPFSLMTYIVDEAKGNVDLVVLEMMIRDQDGIQIAKSIEGMFPDIKIIFMTACAERARDIFQITPFYFFLKPIEGRYIKDALLKAVARIDEQTAEMLVIRSRSDDRKLHTFKIRDIYYVESELRQVIIHESERSKSIYMKLDEVETELPDSFCRCHQSYLVNMDKIREATAREIFLFNGAVIPVSRSRRNEVVERIRAYMTYGTSISV